MVDFDFVVALDVDLKGGEIRVGGVEGRAYSSKSWLCTWIGGDVAVDVAFAFAGVIGAC